MDFNTYSNSSTRHFYKNNRETNKDRVLSIPTVYMNDDKLEFTKIDYSDRAPTDYVISGPIGNLNGGGPGKEFGTVEQAEAWAKDRFGSRLKGKVKEAERGGRWAFLIRKNNE